MNAYGEEYYFANHLRDAFRNHTFDVKMNYPKQGTIPLYKMFTNISLKPNLLTVLDQIFEITETEKEMHKQDMYALSLQSHIITAFQEENINLPFPNGMTLLHVYAKYTNNVTVINYFLQLGADISIKDEKGNRAEKYAIDENKMEMVRLLQKVGQQVRKEKEKRKEEHKLDYAIQLDTSDVILPQIKKKLEYFRQYQKNKPKIPWEGYLTIKEMFSEYLMYKFDQVVCDTIYMDTHNNIQYETIANCIQENPDREILCFMAVYTEPGQPSGHANALIYRRSFHTIEHFEPYGNMQVAYIQPFLDRLQPELSRLLQKKIKFIRKEEMCPVSLGIQALEEHRQTSAGYCLLWSLFIFHMVFRFPTIPTKNIISTVLRIEEKSKVPKYLSEVIIGYAKYVYTVLENYFGEVVKPNQYINTFQKDLQAKRLLELRNAKQEDLQKDIAVLQLQLDNKRNDDSATRLFQRQIADKKTQLKLLQRSTRDQMARKKPVKSSFSKSKSLSQSFNFENIFKIQEQPTRTLKKITSFQPSLKPLQTIPVEEIPIVKSSPKPLQTIPVEEIPIVKSSPKPLQTIPVEEIPIVKSSPKPLQTVPVEETPFVKSSPKPLQTIPVEGESLTQQSSLKKLSPLKKSSSLKKSSNSFVNKNTPFIKKSSSLKKSSHTPIIKIPMFETSPLFKNSIYSPVRSSPYVIRYKERRKTKRRKTIKERLKSKQTKILKKVKPLYQRITKKLKSFFGK